MSEVAIESSHQVNTASSASPAAAKKTPQTIILKTQLEVEFVLPQIPNSMRLVSVNRAGSAPIAGQAKVENDSFLLDVALLDDATINEYLEQYKKRFLDNVATRKADLTKAAKESD